MCFYVNLHKFMLIKQIKCNKPRQFTDQNTIIDKNGNITSLVQYNTSGLQLFIIILDVN